MKSTAYSRFSLRLFGKFFSRRFKDRIDEKNIELEKADILIECIEYYAMALLNTLLLLITTLVVFVGFYLFIPFEYVIFSIILIPSLVTLSIGLTYLYLPRFYIKRRSAQIDLFLPYAVNFINSMSVAGISPSEIFSTLATIDLYGALQAEAKKIAKEINVMNVDNISALKHAIDISPSKKFKAFLQGMIGTIQAGSQLHIYLENIVEKYMEEDFTDRKRDLDLLAIIAEVFVIAVIAFPIFLVIILTVFGFFGGSMDLSINILLIFSLLILPFIYAAFYFLISSTSLEKISKVEKKKKYTFGEYYHEHKLPISIVVISVGFILAFYTIIFVLSVIGYMDLNFYTQLDFIFLSILFLIGPIGFFYYLEMKKKMDIQQRLPEFLIETGDSLNTGMTIFNAIKVSSKAHYGRLSSEIKKMKAQLSWDISMKEVFNNFAERMKSAIIHRVVITINRGLVMGGNTSKIFKSASREVGQVNRLENQRKANMSIYTIVIFLCFFVFLAIIIILDKTIFTSFFELQNEQSLRIGTFVLSVFDPLVLKYSLYSFVFVQSIGTGLLGGFMMDGNLSSGVRFSCVLGLISFFIFKLLL